MGADFFAKPTASEMNDAWNLVKNGVSDFAKERWNAPLQQYQEAKAQARQGDWSGVDNMGTQLAMSTVGEPKAPELSMEELPRKMRAVEMGFDPTKTYYHGTKADIAAFDSSKLGGSTGTKSAAQAHFFSDSPDIAGLFGYIAPNAKSMEVELANKAAYNEYAQLLNKSMDSKISSAERSRMNELGATMESLQARADALPRSKRTDLETNILPVHLKTENPYIVDMKGREFSDTGMSIADHLERARNDGHDSAIFHNAIDTPHQTQRTPSTITAVFDPSQIRSKFAKFDPSEASSGNISAGVGAAIGAGALGAGMMSQDANASDVFAPPTKDEIKGFLNSKPGKIGAMK